MFWLKKAANQELCRKMKCPYLSVAVFVYEPAHDKTYKMACASSEEIRLGTCPVWSEFLLCAQWVAKDPNFLHADSEDWSVWADAQADLSLRWMHDIL